jgi:streptogramin lyase
MASPQSIAADGLGNVWVTNKPSSGTGSVTELTINSSATSSPVYTGTAYTTNVNSPYGVAIDTSNNAWITNTGDNSITKIGPLGASFANYNLNGLNVPEGIAIDGASNVWVVNNGNSTLSGFTSAGAPLTNSPYSGGGLSSPSSIAVNPK